MSANLVECVILIGVGDDSVFVETGAGRGSATRNQSGSTTPAISSDRSTSRSAKSVRIRCRAAASEIRSTRAQKTGLTECCGTNLSSGTCDLNAST